MLPAPCFIVISRQDSLAAEESAYSIWVGRWRSLASTNRLDSTSSLHWINSLLGGHPAEDVAFCRGQLITHRRTYAFQLSSGGIQAKHV
jgi:hypothetical protein